MKLYTLAYILMTLFAVSCYAEVIEIQTPEQFMEIIQNPQNLFIVADFYAPWCQPCLRMAPYFHAVSQGNNNVIFVKLSHSNDAVRNILFNKYDVHQFPTIITFKNGEPTNTIRGTQTAAQLRRMVERLVAS